jgi:formylglycine-generating enzyme required for sulfatase activity
MTLVRQAFVLLLAGLFATLAIFAGDEMKAGKNSLLAALGKSSTQENALCPEDMIAVNTPEGVLCVDRYENSTGKSCPHQTPANAQETQENVSWPECKPASEAGKSPWTNVALHEAATLCARAGKRLPTALEWYRAALGTPDALAGGTSVCNTDAIGKDAPEATGKFSQCLSSAGVYDMVGNVWEWVDETIADGQLGNRTLPDSGYVTSVDQAGIPATIGEAPDQSFNNDYFWIDKTGVRGMFRGGFWGLGDKVGLYAVNATVGTSFTGSGIGFRCVK